MCKIGGIFGFEKIKKKELVYNLVRRLLVEMQSGGPHATGIALIDTELGLQYILKKDVTASEFIKSEVLRKAIFNMNYNLVLLHTRFATHGSPKDNKNNHPFEKNKSVLVHNGVLHNYQEILRSFEITNESECDSETILSLYEKTHNIKTTIQELSGGNAFALYDGKVNKLFLYGSGNDVQLAYNQDKDLFVFNTEEETLTDIFKVTRVFFNFFRKEEVADNLFFMKREDKELVEVDFAARKFKKEIVNSKQKSCLTSYANFNTLAEDEENNISDEEKEWKEVYHN